MKVTPLVQNLIILLAFARPRRVPGGSTHSPMHTAAHTATHSRAHSLAPRSSCLWPGTRSGVYARIYTYVYTSRIYITRRRLQASREHHVKLVSWCVSAAACPSSNEMIQCKIYARVALLLRLQVCAREGVDGLSECYARDRSAYLQTTLNRRRVMVRRRRHGAARTIHRAD